jgi:hypothetical protein
MRAPPRPLARRWDDPGVIVLAIAAEDNDQLAFAYDEGPRSK